MTDSFDTHDTPEASPESTFDAVSPESAPEAAQEALPLQAAVTPDAESEPPTIPALAETPPAPQYPPAPEQYQPPQPPMGYPGQPSGPYPGPYAGPYSGPYPAPYPGQPPYPYPAPTTQPRYDYQYPGAHPYGQFPTLARSRHHAASRRNGCNRSRSRSLFGFLSSPSW